MSRKRLSCCCRCLSCCAAAGMISRKVFVRMSQAERVHYDLFIEQLVEQTGSSIATHCSSSSAPGSSSSSSSLGDRRPSSSSSIQQGGGCLPSHCAVTAYGMAVLGVSSPDLAAAVAHASGLLLRRAAAAAIAEQQSAGQPDAGQQSSSTAAGSAVPVAAVNVAGWSPADIASLLWGLGTLGHTPPRQWLDDAATVSQHMLARYWATCGIAQHCWPCVGKHTAS